MLLKSLALLSAAVACAANVAPVKHCDARGGCDCDCSWAKPSTCGQDDGSCCWGCCCGSAPAPPSPPPTTSPPSPPTPAPPGTKVYCPKAADLTVAYSSDRTPELHDQGWTIPAGGGVATKAAYNLLGGYIEYDFDVSGVPPGVNANIYTISPKGLGSGGYVQTNYCDGADNQTPWCLEVDWIESNGNCGGATTLHTVQGPGSNGCTAWGCRNIYHYNGKTSFHMRIEYGADGSWTTFRDGQRIGPENLSPVPGPQDWSVISASYKFYGGVIYSSQWTGWVPVDDCGTTPGDLSKAVFKISNLKIAGSVVQGPPATECTAAQLNATLFSRD